MVRDTSSKSDASKCHEARWKTKSSANMHNERKEVGISIERILDMNFFVFCLGVKKSFNSIICIGHCYYLR